MAVLPTNQIPGLHWKSMLTHWGQVTHICVNKLTIIGSDNGLPPGRRQAIIWTNAGILLIGPLGTNFSRNLNIFIKKKCIWKYLWQMAAILSHLNVGVGGAVRFLVVSTIGQEERPPRGQLWMEQCLTSSNTGLSSTQYEQIPIILGVWPFWLTPFFFRSITFWRAYG